MLQRIFFLSLFALLIVSCRDDDGQLPEADLHYDSINNGAPFFPVGTHEAAARFPADIVEEFSGRSLTQIQYFIETVPDEVELLVYGPGNSSTPGDVRYVKEVTNEVSSGEWNTHDLDQEILINEEDLWVVVRVSNSVDQAIVGCDPGPSQANGNRFLPAGSDDWTTYFNLTNAQVNINWNIRAWVSEN